MMGAQEPTTHGSMIASVKRIIDNMKVSNFARQGHTAEDVINMSTISTACISWRSHIEGVIKVVKVVFTHKHIKGYIKP